MTSTGPTVSLGKLWERLTTRILCTPGCVTVMVCGDDVVSMPVLVSVESTVILYPPLGAAIGAVQETSTAVSPVCWADKSVGDAPVHGLLMKFKC